MRSARLTLGGLLVALLVAATLGGCNLNVFHDAISTTVEIPVGFDEDEVQASKRFKFERDVAGASEATIFRAWVSVEGVEDVDLSFLSSVEVYIVEPGTEALVPLVTGGGFMPGEKMHTLEVVIDEDVRRFVEDQRVNLEWVVKTNRLYRHWPNTETIPVSFGIVLEIVTG